MRNRKATPSSLRNSIGVRAAAAPSPEGPMSTPPIMSRTVSGTIRWGTDRETRGARKATTVIENRERKTGPTTYSFLGGCPGSRPSGWGRGRWRGTGGSGCGGPVEDGVGPVQQEGRRSQGALQATCHRVGGGAGTHDGRGGRAGGRRRPRGGAPSAQGPGSTPRNTNLCPSPVAQHTGGGCGQFVHRTNGGQNGQGTRSSTLVGREPPARADGVPGQRQPGARALPQ